MENVNIHVSWATMLQVSSRTTKAAKYLPSVFVYSLLHNIFLIVGAENELPWLAKKLAAKNMIELVTKQDYPLESTPIGNNVLGFPEMKLLGFKPKISAIVSFPTLLLFKYQLAQCLNML